MSWSDLLFEKYRAVTNLIGTILIAWILSLIAAEFLGLFLSQKSAASVGLPATQAGFDRSVLADFDRRSVGYYLPICDRNIFDSQGRSVCGSVPEVTEEDGVVEDLDSAPTRSDLAATLLGTLVSSNSEASFANIAPKGGEASNYYIGDTVLGEAKIYDVVRNRVFFVRNGRREYLEVENLPAIYAQSPSKRSSSKKKSGGIKRVGNKSVISRNKVDDVLQNLNKILQQSRMVPNFKNGVVNGFKIFAIKRGSIFQELGLKNGDVVQRINGTDIDTVEKALPMLQLLQTEQNVNIDLLRGGAKKSLSVEIR